MRPLWIVVFAATLLPAASLAQFRLQDAPAIAPKLIKAGRILDVKAGNDLVNQGILPAKNAGCRGFRRM
jgi:hypothetical protein